MNADDFLTVINNASEQELSDWIDGTNPNFLGDRA